MVVDPDAMFIRYVTGIVLQLGLVLGAGGLGYAVALGHIVPTVLLAGFVAVGVVIGGVGSFGLVLAARQHEGSTVW